MEQCRTTFTPHTTHTPHTYTHSECKIIKNESSTHSQGCLLAIKIIDWQHKKTNTIQSSNNINKASHQKWYIIFSGMNSVEGRQWRAREECETWKHSSALISNTRRQYKKTKNTKNNTAITKITHTSSKACQQFYRDIWQWKDCEDLSECLLQQPIVIFLFLTFCRN